MNATLDTQADPFWSQYQQAPTDLSRSGPTAPSPTGGITGGTSWSLPPAVHIDPATGQPVYVDAQGQTVPGPSGSTTPTTAPSGGGKDAFGQAWMASGGRTVQDLKNFVAAHPEYGVKLGGSKGDKVYGPDGAFWADAVISAGTGGNGAAWQTDTGGSGGQNGSSLGSLGYSFGDAMKPLGQFTPPTEQDALNSPGLKFALSEANRMGQNSAAAKGTLLNGRFQQALNASNIGNALQGYQGVFDRALGTFGTNYNVQKDNRDSPFDKNVTLAKLGQPQ